MPHTDSGCYYSEPHVYPENWATGPKSLLKLTWRIDYYFQDPKFKDKYPNGKPVRIKSGINYEKTLEGRRAALKIALQNELNLLQYQDYNPITNTKKALKIETAKTNNGPYSEMPFLEALVAARNLKKCAHNTKLDLDSVIRWTSLAAKNLGYDLMSISEVGRKHIKLILDELERIKKDKWSNSNFNYYRAHLGMLWSELIEYEAVEYNVVEKIKKRPTIQKLRTVLSDSERVLVDSTLRRDHYRFWIFINLFFHSGTRRREICTIRPEQVDLAKQTYRVVVIKGGSHKEVERPIKNIAVPFWEIALRNCQKGQYVFGPGFVPGDIPVENDYATRKWRRIVKNPPTKGGLGIDVDMYALKHLNSDEVTDMLGIEAAAKLNSHSSTKVTLQHYAVNEHHRQMDRIKKADNTFSKAQAIDLSSLP